MKKICIFYDGMCPICRQEMAKLRFLDRAQNLKFIDIHSDEFGHYPQISSAQAQRIIHVINRKNEILIGLDALYVAWSEVGHGWRYAPLRWPGIRVLADRVYQYVANNRYLISRWWPGSPICSCHSSPFSQCPPKQQTSGKQISDKK